MAQRKLSDWIDGFLEYVENSEPADMYKVWTAIVCIAAVLKRKCSLEWGMLTFYPNLYVVLVGPSGCRKGTAMGPGYQLLVDLNVPMAAEATTRESLIRELNKCSDTHTDPITGRLLLHSSLTIFSQELTVFLGYNNTQLMSDLTDWYDCRQRWKYSTKDAKLSDDIINVWVNLFGATTPSMIQTAMPPDAVGLGLTSRIIFVYEKKKGKSCPAPFLSDEAKALRPVLQHDLEMISMMSGKFLFHPDFMDLYVDWYVRQENNPPFHDERLAGYIERRPNHLLKLCMVMSASRSQEMQLLPRDFQRALGLLELTERKMPQVFGGVGRSPLAAISNRIWAAIQEEKTISYAELLNRFGHDVDEQGVAKILGALEVTKKITILRDENRERIIQLRKGDEDGD